MVGCTGRGTLLPLALTIALTCMAAGAACGHTTGSSAGAPLDISSRQARVPGEYLITLVPGTDIKVIADLYGRFGIKGIRDLGSDTFLVIINEDPGPDTMKKLSGNNSRIKAVQPNVLYRTNVAPTPP